MAWKMDGKRVIPAIVDLFILKWHDVDLIISRGALHRRTRS